MSIPLKSVVSATALALALLAFPGIASARSSDPDCIRRVAPPSPNPHDVFRRIVCVPRDDTTGAAKARRELCRSMRGLPRTPEASSDTVSPPQQGADR